MNDEESASLTAAEAEARFRALAELVPDLLWRTDAHGSPDWYNQRWYDYTGQTPAEAVADGWLQALHPADRGPSMSRYQQALAEGSTLRQEHRIRSASGEYRWFQIRSKPVRDAQGRISQWVGAATDIHERHLAEDARQARADAALRASEEQFRLFVTASSDTLYRMSPDWQQLLYMDGQHFQSAAPTPSSTWAEQYSFADDRATIAAAVATAIASKQVFELEHRVVQGDGRVAWVYSRAVPVLDEQGEIVEWFGAATDISARKQAEAELQALTASLEQQVAERTQALRASRDVLQSIYDTTLVGMTVLEAVRGADGTVLDFRMASVNQELTRESGRTDLVGKLYAEEFPGVRASGLLDQMREVVETGVPQQLEYFYPYEDRNQWYSASFVRLGDGLVTTTLNISARKQTEAESQRLAEENLHLRLTQQQARIEAVLTAQEEERRRIAESLHNGVGQLLYAVKLQFDQLGLAPALKAVPELAAMQRQATGLLSDAIRQARTLSHELTPGIVADFGLAAALHDICHKLKSPGLYWQCLVHLDEEYPVPEHLQVAAYRLAQELTQNVIKHAHATQATLEVETLPGWLVLRAEDNGRGFDPAAPSAGIGLPSLRNRVALLGGSVRLEAAPGRGTRVQVRVPL
ncbi:PAS domain-containing protein [Hymenobacter sp. ASUV-10]|uniref:Oxygen sensor histidine kinase NreB n=1 Tax=Hymenobacter aranciens TaxID=3063996 RepID=A0ABT9B7D2_9BACT|nr:PAS domain-containing protein [Hymenobacter sp. ASUV-10]MDO7873700.1 PAS domain-containing protein [Hymenobacter sp. ASUV-10]